MQVLDTKTKIRHAQQKLIKDSRTIIKGIQTYGGSYTRKGLTKSIHHNTPLNPPTPSQIYNAYSSWLPTKFLLNAITLELTFDSVPVKQCHTVTRQVRAIITGLGYKPVKIQHTLAPVEIRLINNEIYRHEAKIHTPRASKQGGTLITVDICDYAIRPCYEAGMLMFDQRPSCVYQESFKMVRQYTLQKLRMPIFDDNGYYNGFMEVDRAFYDGVTGIEPPKLYHDRYTDEAKARIAKMHEARKALGLVPFQKKVTAEVCS